MFLTDWPALNTPQLSSKELKQLEDKQHSMNFNKELKEWSSINMQLREELRKLPPQYKSKDNYGI